MLYLISSWKKSSGHKKIVKYTNYRIRNAMYNKVYEPALATIQAKIFHFKFRLLAKENA